MINLKAWSRRVAAWTIAAIVVGRGMVATAQESQKEFQKFTGAPEPLPGAPFIFAAYAFVWVALIVYVFMLWRRIGKVEQELADVNLRLANRK